jgi:hypothetical protein
LLEQQKSADVAEKDSKCWRTVSPHESALGSSHEKSFAINGFPSSWWPGAVGIGFAPNGVTENSPVRHHLD